MTFLRINIITTMDRNQAILVSTDQISRCGGWIIYHALFSNMAANVNFELPLSNTEICIQGLEASGFKLSFYGELPTGNEGNTRGCLSFTFLQNEINLKRDVRAFG